MSSRDVLIIHGWSDTSKSFSPLVEYLRNAGFNAVALWLGDYISLDDDVKIEDIGPADKVDITPGGATKGFNGKSWNSSKSNTKKFVPIGGPVPARGTQRSK